MDSLTLHHLLEISRELSAKRLLDPLLNYAMNMAIKLVHAERGFLVMRLEDGSFEYRIKLDSAGNELNNPDGEVSHSILRTVMEERKTRVVSNAAIDPDFQTSDSVVALRLRSVICAPLVIQDEVLGAIYLENRSVVDVFDEKSIEPLELFASHAAVTIKNALLNDELEERVEARTLELQKLNEKLVMEINERRAIEEQLKTLSITDPLTGLFNRRHFYELVEREISRCLRYHHNLAVLMLDLDHFKQVNDLHGHLVGDQTLKAVANLCANLVRENDVVARFGGEEFVVLMPETYLEQARIAAERIRSVVEKTSIVTNAGDISVTISIGVTEWNAQGEMVVDKLIDLADQALYRAKQAGRNRISF